MGGGDLQLREDLCLVRPCPCLAPNSTVATLKLALISELCVLTLMHESEKYVIQHAPSNEMPTSSQLPRLHMQPLPRCLSQVTGVLLMQLSLLLFLEPPNFSPPLLSPRQHCSVTVRSGPFWLPCMTELLVYKLCMVFL